MVPLLQTADDTFQDFIIIAEFSEMEGPTPLCTIPNDAPSKTDINLNNLAVHLMSTDYQVNTVGHFKVCEDTQVMRTNVFKNVHVFMQYFTLYDIKARGFVRPFCFGYVSKDHIKIDRNVSKFATEFDKITHILKHTNRQWFSTELQKYLLKLKNAKEDYINSKSQNAWQTTSLPLTMNNENSSTDIEETGIFSLDDTSDLEDISLNQIANQYTEISSILQTVKNTAVDPSCEADVKMLSFYIQHLHPKSLLKSTLENFGIRHVIPNPNDQVISVDSDFESLNVPLVHPLKQKGESLRPLTTLGQLGTVILVWRLMRLELQKRSDFIFSEMEILARNFEKHCTSLNGSKSPLFEASIKTVISDRTVLLDSDDDECNTNSSSNVNSNNTNSNGCHNEDEMNCGDDCEYEHFELLLNDNLCKVIEKIHSAVAIVPDNKSGSYHSLSDESDGVIQASGNENESSSYNSAIGSVESQKTGHDELNFSFKAIPPHQQSHSNYDQQQLQQQRNNVSSVTDSYASSGTTITPSDSFITPSASINASSSQYHPHPPSSLKLGKSSTNNTLESPVLEKEFSEDNNIPQNSSSSTTSTYNTRSSSMPLLSGGGSGSRAFISSTSISSNLDRGSETRCSISSYSSSDEDFNFSGSSSDFSAPGSIEMIEKSRWYATMSRKMSKGQPGYGILKFFRHFYQVAHHVLYSITIGRPVVICGSESYKSRIGQILTALIPLVPCYPEKSWKLLRWHRGILVPAHFKQNAFKIIGLCIPERLVVHDLMSPKDVNSVTILNAETKSILGPCYSGTFFSNFEQKCQKFFQDDVSLMGYLGCIFTEVETKVFLYKSLQSDGMKAVDIGRKLDLKGADIEIVKFLSSLIHDIENVVEIF